LPGIGRGKPSGVGMGRVKNEQEIIIMMKKIIFNLVIISLLTAWNSKDSLLYSQEVTLYPDIPRIDVHTHVGDDLQAIQNYLKLRDQIIDKHHIDFAMWINLGVSNKEITNLSEVLAAALVRALLQAFERRGKGFSLH
jgi:hypothetical protein